MRLHRRGRRGSRGQAIYELACILPLMLGLFVGGYSMTESITDDQLVNVAVGQAARYAAEVGNNHYTATTIGIGCQAPTLAGGKDPCEADKLVIGTLLPLLQQMISVTVTEVDIYQPPTCTPNATAPLVINSCPAHVGYVAASDPAERFNGSGVFLANGTAGVYSVDKRVQSSPNEASIGVSVTYTYAPPTHVFSLTLTQFCAYRLEPTI